MHRNGDLWFKLSKDLLGELRSHRAPAADWRECHVHLAERFDLLLV